MNIPTTEHARIKQRIGGRLRLCRERLGISQVEAARRIGVTNEHLSVVERGGAHPSLDMLIRAAKVYGTELVDFFLFLSADTHEQTESSQGQPECDFESPLITGAGVWTMDFALNRDFWSRGLRQMLGFSDKVKPDVAAFLRVVQPGEAAKAKRFLAKLRDKGRLRPLTCGLLREDGIAKRCFLLADQLEDESDIPDQARLVILDITDWEMLRSMLSHNEAQLTRLIEDKTSALRQAAAEAQRELRLRETAEQTAKTHKAQLQQILTAVPAILYSFSPNHGGRKWHSPHIQQILGISQQELQADPTHWHDAIHPDDLSRVNEAIARAQQGRPMDVEYRILGWDGQWRWMHDKADVFRDASGQVHLAGVAVNVTEAKLAAEALEQSRKLFRDVAEDTPALICRYDPGCIITYANEAYCRCFGRSYAELEGTSFLDLMPKADQAPFLAALARMTPENPTVRTELQVFDLEGKIRWHRWIDRAIFDASGRTVAYQGIGEDITEQKHTLEALRTSEELYRSIYTRSPIAIELYDSSGRLVEVNPVCLELFGVQDVRELQGFDLFADPNLKAEDIELLKQGETACFETEFDFEKVRQHNLYRTTRTGTIWLSVLITPLGHNGANGYLAQVQDITARELARERLLDQRSRLVNILKGTNVGTWEWNVQTGATVFNERWAEIVGYDLDELDPVSIATWMGLAHPEDLRASEDILRRHFRGEIDFYECEARMRHRDGHWVWVLDRGRVITWTDDGKPLWMFGTHQDITQRKLAEAGEPDHDSGAPPPHPDNNQPGAE